MPYIRFGNPPADERSGIYDGDVKIGEEKGVSVYDAVFHLGRYHIQMPHIITKQFMDTLYGFLKDGRECFLVNGSFVGFGSDGETLLRNVRILRRIRITNKSDWNE